MLLHKGNERNKKNKLNYEEKMSKQLIDLCKCTPALRKESEHFFLILSFLIFHLN